MTEKVAENPKKVAEKVAEKRQGVAETEQKANRKRAEKGIKLTENRIKILELIEENPYISRSEMAKVLGISDTSVYRNIEAMRGKYLRRVGADKGGFWEIIE